MSSPSSTAGTSPCGNCVFCWRGCRRTLRHSGWKPRTGRALRGLWRTLKSGACFGPRPRPQPACPVWIRARPFLTTCPSFRGRNLSINRPMAHSVTIRRKRSWTISTRFRRPSCPMPCGCQ
uniref:Uncharacterized protein n=1 Tax=Actinobacteria phage HS02 TaxID=3056388 RepID=A0AA49X4K6_9VIRU|nr:MAG: hypothetical protein [Actinobacteria phage HS02]